MGRRGLCSCESGWLGNVETGKCYKASGTDTQVDSYTAADTACKVNISSTSSSLTLLNSSGPGGLCDQHHLRHGERLHLEQLREVRQHLVGRDRRDWRLREDLDLGRRRHLVLHQLEVGTGRDRRGGQLPRLPPHEEDRPDLGRHQLQWDGKALCL